MNSTEAKSTHHQFVLGAGECFPSSLTDISDELTSLFGFLDVFGRDHFTLDGIGSAQLLGWYCIDLAVFDAVTADRARVSHTDLVDRGAAKGVERVEEGKGSCIAPYLDGYMVRSYHCIHFPLR